MNKLKLLLLGLGLGGGVFAFDRWTKFFFFQKETTAVLDGLLETASHHNFGLIANLAVPTPLILILTISIALGVGWAYLQSLQKEEALRSIAFVCILSGALGNLYDRLTLGFVFDWILLFRISVLNIADIAIGIGILLFIITLDQKTKTG